MASSHLVTKTTSLLLRFSFCKYPSRSFHGIMPSLADYERYRGSDIDKKSEGHPFQSSGPRGRCLMKEIESGLLLWSDMPGVGKSHVKVWTENNTVFYQGRAPRVNAYETGREYSGNFRLVMGFGKMEDVTAVVENGVVRIFMPYYSAEA